MPSDIETQLQNIKDMIIHGKFPEALNKIEKGLKKKNISKEEELRFLILKSDIMWYLGNHQEALLLANDVLKKSIELDNHSLQLDALIQKTASTIWSGKVKDGLQIAEEALALLTKTSNLPASKIAEHKARLLHFKATGIGQSGDREKGIELVKEALSFAKESGCKRAIITCTETLGAVYISFGKLNKSEKLLEKARVMTTELGNNYYIALNHIHFAYLNHSRREYEEAIDSYERARSLIKEIGTTAIRVDNDLGLVYRAIFQLDKALECFHDSLKNRSFRKHIPFTNIGYTYFLQYDLEQAQEYFLKAMNFCEEIQDKRILPWVLYYLILISIELKKLPQAQKYLKQLKEISVEVDLERIDQVHRFAHIMLLKASGSISDLVKAADMLKEFLKEKDIPASWYMLADWRLEALYTLLEIRIKELQLSATKATLEEVKKQTIRLEVEAKEQQRRWLLTNVYRLQSKFSLVELDIKRAIEFLDKAQIIADEIDIELLHKGLREDRENIEKQLVTWNQLQEQKAPISETIKHASLDETVQNIKQETILEERDKKTGNIIEYRKLFALKI